MNITKKTFLVLVLFGCIPGYASFLQPVNFPKTVDDLSLSDRIALKKGDYEQYESEYDANGNCIAGCSYALPKWEDELAAMERVNRLSHQELITQHGYIENSDGSLTPPPIAPNQPPRIDTPSAIQPGIPSSVNPPDSPIDPGMPYRPVQPTSPGVGTSPVSGAGESDANCADRNPRFENRGIPYKNPLGYVACITSPYGPRELFNRKFHYGIDFRAKIGTPVYAPANGKVSVIFSNNKTCGNGIVIEHSSGYSTKYCHLDSVAVKKGDKVSAGCLIGKSGNTGPSTGPHLHYSVLKDGNAIDPADFLEPGHKSCY